ncbi:isocitrate lyase/phosphoenolpyruvate mutase family protein [Paraflavitalea soli]|uniref:Isocitrate lyase/phosphoenolpyruvate mutase family protein n=1 Tax=Paraflavitalea soli TaxID=2315862 RepID=A0A3B7MQD9_9BACT|nr:isocitrate lyase/phosphoenolpyruvate mutase family protein [Paraflavitalea soli]AXY76358.1 isocitrate lyase/phosphoenolpyruvate mutase family protein [Paraflavitalea soli]
MSSSFNQFNSLHTSPDLFVLPNVWNAKSAIRFQENHFPAVATSSAAVANSLGYQDGEDMPFSDYLFIIRRIISSVKIPLSVDIEMGYGKSREAIYNNIRQLIDLGVAGINIEDSLIQGSGRVLGDADAFAQTIAHIRNGLAIQNARLFINVRCDTFLLNIDNKVQESIRRLALYEASGADGIFLPCITRETDIAEVVSHTKLPLNVMCIPRLPDFDALQQLGVKRVSMGPFLFNKAYGSIDSLSQAIAKSNSFAPILS